MVLRETIFSISTKIQDGGQNLEKSKFLRGPGGVVLSTVGVQSFPKFTLSLTVFKINDIFHFLQTSRYLLLYRSNKIPGLRQTNGRGGYLGQNESKSIPRQDFNEHILQI